MVFFLGMRFSFFPLIGLLLSWDSVQAESDLPLADLTDDAVRVREEAQAKIIEWASKNQERAKEELLKIYAESYDPELRRRLILPLERAYFPQKGYLGVQMTSGRYDELGRLLAPEEQKSGVLIKKVMQGTPAALGGLQTGDSIVQINEQRFEGENRVELVAKEIQRHSPDTPIRLIVEREGKPLEMRFKLGILPVPSERALLQRRLGGRGNGGVSLEVSQQLSEFRRWLLTESAKERKNLIADRRS